MVNIAVVTVMGRITQIAAVENATAIWEYDPSLPGNCILGSSLDVIATIQIIAVKVSLPFFFIEIHMGALLMIVNIFGSIVYDCKYS